MNSEERLVAQVALELLQANATVLAAGDIVLADGEDPLELPCTVVSVTSGQQSSGPTAIPGAYTLTVERRALRVDQTAEEDDETFRAIGTALDTMPDPVPATLTASFHYYRIEEWTGTASQLEGETAIRSRSYSVFAQLL